MFVISAALICPFNSSFKLSSRADSAPSLTLRLFGRRHRYINPNGLLGIGDQRLLTFLLPAQHTELNVVPTGIEKLPRAADVHRDIARINEVRIEKTLIEEAVAAIGRKRDARVETSGVCERREK